MKLLNTSCIIFESFYLYQNTFHHFVTQRLVRPVLYMYAGLSCVLYVLGTGYKFLSKENKEYNGYVSFCESIVENSFHNVCVADLDKYPDNQILQDILHIKCSCQ